MISKVNLSIQMPSAKPNWHKHLLAAQKLSGKSIYRQGFEIMRLVGKPCFLGIEDYYKFALYRTHFSSLDRAEFLSQRGSNFLNAQLSPLGPRNQAALFLDKTLFSKLTESCGIVGPKTLAVYSTKSLAKTIPLLADLPAVTAFLKSAKLPLFGKPQSLSRALGVFSLFSRSNSGEIGMLSNGQEVLLDDLAQDIVSKFPDGYLFQEFIDQHPKIKAFTPNAVGTLRVLTVMESSGPEPLTAIWRVPGLQATADSYLTGGNITYTVIDLSTGKVKRVQNRKLATDQTQVDTHEDTGKVLNGFEVPWFHDCLSAAIETHKLFQGHGIIGFDFALGVTGPIMLEGNSNPNYSQSQFAYDQGFLNPTNRKVFKGVIARMAKQ
jgi:hypothetical protein